MAEPRHRTADFNMWFHVLLLMKDQLRRLQILSRQANSTLAAIGFTQETLGRGQAPASFERFSELSHHVFSPPNLQDFAPDVEPPMRQADSLTFGFLFESVLRTYLRLVARLAPEEPTCRLYGVRPTGKTAGRPADGRPYTHEVYAFLHAYSSARQMESRLLPAFRRIRERLSQELDHYPSILRFLPRYHNRESSQSMQFFHLLAESYSSVLTAMGGPLFGKPDLGDYTISLTFNYTEFSNLWVENNDKPSRTLLIESPYYYLDSPQNGVLLAHEISHGFINHRIFGGKERCVDGEVFAILDDLRRVVQTVYGSTHLTEFFPRLGSEIITEFVADVLALVIGGPYYLFSFLTCVVGIQDIREKLTHNFPLHLRLQILCQVCQRLYRLPSRDDSLRHFYQDELVPLAEFVDGWCAAAATRKLWHDQLAYEEHRQVTSAVAGISSHLVEGLTELFDVFVGRYARWVAREPQKAPHLYLPCLSRAEEPKGTWLSQLLQDAGACLREGKQELATRCEKEKLDVGEAYELYRALPGLVWREGIRWNRHFFTPPDPDPHEKEGGAKPLLGDGARKVLGAHAPLERLFDFAWRVIGAGVRTADYTLGEFYPSGLLRMRCVSTVPTFGTNLGGCVAEMLRQTAKDAALENTTPRLALAFGPADVLWFKEFQKNRPCSFERYLLAENRKDRTCVDLLVGKVKNNEKTLGAIYYRDYYFSEVHIQGIARGSQRRDDDARPQPSARWTALIHLNLKREVVSEAAGESERKGTSDAGQEVEGGGNRGAKARRARSLQVPLTNEVKTVRLFMEELKDFGGLSLERVFLGHGHWDILLFVRVENIYELMSFYERMNTSKSETPQLGKCIDRTMLMPAVDVEQDEPWLRQLGGEEERSKPLPPMPLPRKGYVVVTAVQRGHFEPRDGEEAEDHLPLSGRLDELVVWPVEGYFPNGRPDAESGRRLFSDIARLYDRRKYLFCETAFQVCQATRRPR